MALKPPPPPWEVLAQMGDLVGGTGAREEIDRNIRALEQLTQQLDGREAGG